MRRIRACYSRTAFRELRCDAVSTYLDGHQSRARRRGHRHLALKRRRSRPPVPLEHVFLVLDLKTAAAGRRLFLREDRPAGLHSNRMYVSVAIPLRRSFGESRQYELHVFTDGVRSV